MKKIYIAGAGGMLGEAFFVQFKNDYELKCTDKDVNAPWLSFRDFTDLGAYFRDVREFKPDYLFHLGAITDLEFCEKNSKVAFRNNTEAVAHAITVANELDIPLLYIGTAGIFDGKKEFYEENDLPSPLGVYAWSKMQGERLALAHARRRLVCRAGWMMGGGPKKDKKFIGKIMKQLKAGARELHIVLGKAGTPTYTHDFAANVRLLIERGESGLFNMVCSGKTTRILIAQEILSILGLQDFPVIPERPEYFQNEYFAPRPDCEALISAKLDAKKLNIMRPWRLALREYLETYYNGYL